MPLVLGFAALGLMFVLIDHAISGASYKDILTGKSGEDFRQAQANAANSVTVIGNPTSATPLAGVAGSVGKPVGISGGAKQLLSRLKARGVKVDANAYSQLQQGRIDQGVDFGGAGPVAAVADGVVKYVGAWPGWPGVGGVVYETALGPVFVMEDFIASVRVGQRVRAGQIIGHATGGSHGIETGLANSSHTGPLTPYNGRPDGTPTEGGQAFAALLGLLGI